MNELINKDKIKEGHLFLAEDQIKEFKININDTLTVGPQKCTVDSLEYLASHNCVMANCSNGQRIAISKLRKMIDAGQIKLN